MTNHSERFILRTTLTSPFGRKVRMAADVLGLNDRVTVMPADTADETDTIRQQNPLGKIPCLVRADGTTIYDSGVIVEFLQDVAGTDRLLPTSGPARFPAFTRTRLADGIIDAGALTVYEHRYHEAGTHSERWLAHQRGKIARAVAAFEAAPPEKGTVDAVAIGLACALAFLDKRIAIEWRTTSPRLVEWFTHFVASEPSFDRTSAPTT